MSTSGLSEPSVERFPLDPDRVETSLAEIRQDLGVLTGAESTYLEFNNPELYFVLAIGVRTWPVEKTATYTEGALTAYKLAREAGTAEGVLPRLSGEGRSSLFSSMVVAPSASKRVGSAPVAATATWEALETELGYEPSIAKVVGRLAAQHRDRDAYYAGAATVVAGLRLAVSELSVGE
jgi:hypothetical protein